MRWDFGIVLKEIRQSKGLTQSKVCGNYISRAALSKIEKGEAVPNLETMVFLLDQMNMSMEEFRYICSDYYPSERLQIISKFEHYIKQSGTKHLVELKEDCENYLKKQHNVFIEWILDVITIGITVRENGFSNPSSELQNLTQKIWDYLEKQDTWYERDLKMLNTILYSFPIDSLLETTKRILASLEKYNDYYNILNTKYSLLTNLATIFLYNGNTEECYRLTQKTLSFTEQSKRYDHLGFCWVRLGICKKDRELVNKGLSLLELTNEFAILENCQQEIEKFFNTLT